MGEVEHTSYAVTAATLCCKLNLQQQNSHDLPKTLTVGGVQVNRLEDCREDDERVLETAAVSERDYEVVTTSHHQTAIQVTPLPTQPLMRPKLCLERKIAILVLIKEDEQD